jgi:excisionase family DNA binding protein
VTPATSLAALPLLLTVDEVAALLRTTRKAIYAKVERGQIPHVRISARSLLFDRDELLRWMDERRAPSPGGSRR